MKGFIEITESCRQRKLHVDAIAEIVQDKQIQNKTHIITKYGKEIEVNLPYNEVISIVDRSAKELDTQDCRC